MKLVLVRRRTGLGWRAVGSSTHHPGPRAPRLGLSYSLHESTPRREQQQVPRCKEWRDVLHANQAPLPVIWRHSRSSAFPRALDAVTECSQSTHPTHRWVRKPGSPFEEHFGQQAPAAQLTGAQAPAGELIGHRSPARSRAAFAPRPSGRSCWPLTASAPARQILSPRVKQTQSTRCG